jgi:hypothetical protein
LAGAYPLGALSPRTAAVFAPSDAADNDISRNRDFYKVHDVRPPFTYAALIRQVGTMRLFALTQQCQ